jgi:queuosine precursor transporter
MDMKKLESRPSQTNQGSYRYFDLVMVAFVTVLIVSNIASSAKIVDWGVSLFHVPLAFDAGTILFPVSYIFGDILTEVYGYRRSRRVIWSGFVMLALTSTVFFVVRQMPGEAGWSRSGGQQAYDLILGGFSSGGIVLASLIAYITGEFSNSVILAKMKLLTRGRWLWTRTISSTLVGEAVDTLIFVLVATVAGVFPWEIFLSLAITNYVFKVGIEIVLTPLTYWVVSSLKRLENEDFYDWNTNFNPFGG